MSVSREQIEENLREIIARRKTSLVDRVPDGWITSRDAAKIAGISMVRIMVYLRESVKNGEIARKRFRIAVGPRARIFPVVHYFLGKSLRSK